MPHFYPSARASFIPPVFLSFALHCRRIRIFDLWPNTAKGAGLEEVLAREDNLAMARAIYKSNVSYRPGRLIMLCDEARVARSDRPETMPQ